MQQSQISFIQIDMKLQMRVANSVTVLGRKQFDAIDEMDICCGNAS